MGRLTFACKSLPIGRIGIIFFNFTHNFNPIAIPINMIFGSRQSQRIYRPYPNIVLISTTSKAMAFYLKFWFKCALYQQIGLFESMYCMFLHRFLSVCPFVTWPKFTRQKVVRQKFIPQARTPITCTRIHDRVPLVVQKEHYRGSSRLPGRFWILKIGQLLREIWPKTSQKVNFSWANCTKVMGADLCVAHPLLPLAKFVSP